MKVSDWKGKLERFGAKLTTPSIPGRKIRVKNTLPRIYLFFSYFYSFPSTIRDYNDAKRKNLPC